MPVQVTTNTTRADISVPFWNWKEADVAYIKTNYIDTGKMTAPVVILSENQHAKSVIRTFASPAVLDEYQAESIWLAATEEQRAYNRLNMQTTTSTVAVVE